MRGLVPDYEIIRPIDLQATLDFLSAYPQARPIAGGTDLMVVLEAGKLRDKSFVDLSHLPELHGIQITDTKITLGALTSYTDIREHPVLSREFPLLDRSASWTGAIAIQNRGTLGGNIANASPAADTPPVLLCYDAEVTLLSSRGERTVLLKDFFKAYKKTALQAGEIVKSVSFARKFSTWKQFSRKVGTRKAQAISKVMVAAVADISDGLVQDVRLAFGSVGPFPLRALRTEALLRGQKLDAAAINAARSELMQELKPLDDVRSTSVYRLIVSANILEDFLREHL